VNIGCPETAGFKNIPEQTLQIVLGRVHRAPPSMKECSRENTQMRDAMIATQKRAEARRCRVLRFIVESPGYRGAGRGCYRMRGKAMGKHK
jgi:hypothetical protein